MIPKNNDMRFEVTTRCNYNCVICPRDKLTRKLETMSFELFALLFDKIRSETRQYNTLTFPGMGEPLMDPSLVRKIEYAKKADRDLDVLILTNGSLLTPERFGEFEDLGVTSVRVSLYGADAESYRKIHRPKSDRMFDTVKENLLKIVARKKNTKLLLTYNVVDGVNDDVLQDWISFWEDKADLIEVWRPHNWVNGRRYRAVQKDKAVTCGRPFNGPLQIQVDGTVNMCCFDFDGRLTIGDLKKQTLHEIFSSPAYNRIMKCHQAGRYAGSRLICASCDQRNTEKKDVMVYNSKFDIKERVRMISTTYKKLKTVSAV